MQPELDAAVSQLCSMLPASTPAAARTRFGASLLSSLRPRLAASSWLAAEPERGSAARALLWHEHAGGEGGDAALRAACEAAAIAPKDALPALTLWIDPGCVSMRLGPGPGANADCERSAACAPVTLVWGTLPAALAPSPRATHAAPLRTTTPALSINDSHLYRSHTPTPLGTSSWGAGLPRPVRIVDPASRRSPPPPPMLPPHVRSPSASSAATSFSASLSRSVSASSSAYGTSVSSACPSLMAPGDGSDSELSADDLDVLGGPGGYGIIDLIDDESDIGESDVGDATLMCNGNNEDGDTTIGASPVKAAAVSGAHAWTPKRLPPSGAAPLNYTLHDNGNVGVLGGGVRLGGASPTKSGAAPTHGGLLRHTFNAAARGFQPAEWSVPPPPSMCAPPHMAAVQAPAFGAGAYPQLPMPPSFYAPQPSPTQMLFNSHAAAFQQQQQPPRQPMLPAVHQPHYSGVEGHQAPPPYAMYHGAAPGAFLALDPNAAGAAPMKRVRSRGRRSRGRGAGRAARRQAAALKALAERDGLAPPSGSELGDEYDDDEGDDDESDADECEPRQRSALPPPPRSEAQILAVVRERAAQLSRDIERRCEAAAAANAAANASWAPHSRGLSATPRAPAIGTF